MLAKLTTMSAMKRPTMPKTPPLAPTNARHVSSKAALKKLPAQEPAQHSHTDQAMRYTYAAGAAQIRAAVSPGMHNPVEVLLGKWPALPCPLRRSFESMTGGSAAGGWCLMHKPTS